MTDQHNITFSTEQNIQELLQKQNETLQKIETLLAESMHTKEDNTHHVNSRITDFDMSIGSMIKLSFKWIIASIPVGIVIFVLYLILIGMAVGAMY